jgi:hypothetical protein
VRVHKAFTMVGERETLQDDDLRKVAAAFGLEKISPSR